MPRVGRTAFGLHRYGPVLRAPGARRIALGALAGRSGQIGLGLASLLAVRHATGSYAVAGAALGVSTLATGLTRVVQGRLADRVGTAPVLVVSCVLHAAVLLVFLSALAERVGSVALVLLTGLLGASVPAVAAITRALWTALLPEPEHNAPAHTIESALTEICAMVGPAIAGVLAATASPTVAVIAMAAFAIAGALTVATVRDDGIGRGGAGSGRGGLLRPLAVPILAMVALGGMVGALELGVPAFADDHDRLAMSGVLIALWGSGSVVSGLLYGARDWRSRAEVRLVACFALMTAWNAVLPFAGSIAALALLLVPAGIAFTPAMTTVFMLIDGHVPHGRRTEAFAWVTSAPPSGIALGSAVGGWAVSRDGTAAAFFLAAASAAVGLGLALWLARAHAPGARPHAG